MVPEDRQKWNQEVPKFKGWPKEVLPSGDLKFKVAAGNPKDTVNIGLYLLPTIN